LLFGEHKGEVEPVFSALTVDTLCGDAQVSPFVFHNKDSLTGPFTGLKKAD
jgi:hypothetical protein